MTTYRDTVIAEICINTMFIFSDFIVIFILIHSGARF